MGTGNDEIVLTGRQEKTNPITKTNESTRRRRDLTEQLEEEEASEEVADQGEEEKILGRAAKQGSIESEEATDEQFPDAEGVSSLAMHVNSPVLHNLLSIDAPPT